MEMAENNTKSSLGTIAMGVRLPLIRENDDIVTIIYNSIINSSIESGFAVNDNDIIAITESLVARAFGNYVTVDDIADDITHKFGINSVIGVYCPIFSRNRFSLILKGIARAAKEVVLFFPNNGIDEVGNEVLNPYTNIDIESYYRQLVEDENCLCQISYVNTKCPDLGDGLDGLIVSTIHTRQGDYEYLIKKVHGGVKIYKLDDICSVKLHENWGYNKEFGVLGSNKAGKELLKLFPKRADCESVCKDVQRCFRDLRNVDVHVMVYGDGAFKDPVSGIWEFADPVVSPYFTDELNGTPNEVKIKYLLDSEANFSDADVLDEIKREVNGDASNTTRMGTTPRHYPDLIGSLSDLISGSGDKGTPVVWIKNYFKKYCD